MIISEKELEDMIFNADKEDLAERGLLLPYKIRRQVRIGNYGIADMVGYERGCKVKGWQNSPTVYIFELKKEQINIYTFLQAVRYAKGIMSYFRYKDYMSPNINIALIGNSIDFGNEFLYLPDLLSCEKITLELYTYSLKFNGIFFKSHYGYYLKKEGFNEKQTFNTDNDLDFTDF